MINRQGRDCGILDLPRLQPFPGEPLIATQMVGNPEIGVRAGERGGMSDLDRDGVSKLRDLQQLPSLIGAAIQGMQAAKQAELVLQVADFLRQRQTTPERGLAFMAVALRKHGRMPERPKQLHLRGLLAGCILQYGERAPRPDATFLQQIALHKQPRAHSREGNPQVRLSRIGIDPGKRGPGVTQQIGAMGPAARTLSSRFVGARLQCLQHIACVPQGRHVRCA